MKRSGLLIVVIFVSLVYPIDREYRNGPSFYLGIGDVFGIIGINALDCAPKIEIIS
jgi:hypothetical protein